MRAFIKTLIKDISVLYFSLFNRRIHLKWNSGILLYRCKAIIKKGMTNNIISLMGGRGKLNNCTFLFYGNNNMVHIGKNVYLSGVTFWIEDNNNSIYIGDNTTIGPQTQLAACEGSTISIGEDCMFSSSVHLRTTDSHSIVNAEGIRVNPAKDIKIGNHVWIGQDVMILKGTEIPDNCIIGAKSIVTSTPKISNTIYCGNPARAIKENVNWQRDKIKIPGSTSTAYL